MQNHDKKKEQSALLAALGTFTIFGFSFMFSRIALDYLNTSTLLMFRFLLAFVCINLLVLALSRKKDVPNWLQFHLKEKSILPLIPLGLLQPIIYFICETNGIRLTSSSLSGVLIATIPIFAMLSGFIFLRERVRPLQILFVLISIAGVSVLAIGQADSGTIYPLGIVYLLGAVLSGCLFNTFSRKISATYTPLESTYVMMALGAVIYTVAALIQGVDLQGIFHFKVIVALVYLAVLSSIVAFLLLNYANSILPVARTTSFNNLTTVLSLFAGVVFLGEVFSVRDFICAAVIVLGIIGVQKFAE